MPGITLLCVCLGTQMFPGPSPMYVGPHNTRETTQVNGSAHMCSNPCLNICIPDGACFFVSTALASRSLVYSFAQQGFCTFRLYIYRHTHICT